MASTDNHDPTNTGGAYGGSSSDRRAFLTRSLAFTAAMGGAGLVARDLFPASPETLVTPVDRD